jgi:4-hydroxy-4-methyl-2-oxoglutarate aldolase
MKSVSRNGVSRDTIAALRHFDTCTLSNAVERLDIRPRNEGFIARAARCQFREMKPVVGFAATGRIRSSMPPVKGRCYYENIDWWRYLDTLPEPRIIVMQDGDRLPGFGALFGEVHARICRAMNCVAYVTNGAVRDLPGVRAAGLQLFAGNVAVSHAYAHVVEFGETVEIGGLRIAPGDLLHGDLHGVLSVPLDIAGQLPPVAAQLAREEGELFELCESGDFSVDKLAAKLEERSNLEPCQ